MGNIQSLPIGTTLQSGRYVIEGVLGNGGFGITYLASQPMLDRKVAIKEFFYGAFCNRQTDNNTVSVVSKGGAETVMKFRTKFLKEASTLANLKHPNIVEVHDVFEENGTAYYVMEHIDGPTLSTYVKEHGRIDEERAVGYMRKIASALDYIHQQHINHLDVKPGNIMLRESDGEVILIDFGMAKHYDVRTGDGTTTTPIGISAGYAPMEQYRLGGVASFTPVSDIYSVGATLYKLVTGTTPAEASLLKETAGMPPVAGVKPATSLAIQAAMRSRSSERPQSIGQWLDILDGKVVPTFGTTPAGPQLAGNGLVADVTIEEESPSVHAEKAEVKAEVVKPAPQKPEVQKPRYIDYEWPEDNTGWFVGVFSLNGRWRRRECLGIYFVCLFGLVVLSYLSFLSLLMIPVLVALYGAVCKRLHDVNLTSKWVILFLTFRAIAMLSRDTDPRISLVFDLLCDLPIIILFFWPPTKGVNRYGSNPRRDYEEQCVEMGLPRPGDCI